MVLTAHSEVRRVLLGYGSDKFGLAFICFFGKKNQSLWQWISLELHYNQDVSLLEQKGWNTAKRVKRSIEFDCKPLLWAP